MWRLWIRGALMSRWSGPLQVTMEIQRSQVTQFRRQTKRLEWVYIKNNTRNLLTDGDSPKSRHYLFFCFRTGLLCWTITIDWMPPSLTSSWVTPTSLECFLKTSVEWVRKPLLQRRKQRLWRQVWKSENNVSTNINLLNTLLHHYNI